MTSERKQERNTLEAETFVFHRFPFRPRVQARTIFSGNFRSKLTGEESEFYTLREYMRGDDAKKIHWKHYAKAGELMVREDIRESNIRMWLAQDLSSSMRFGEKPVLVKGFYALLGHILHEGGNVLGVIGFTDTVTFFQAPSMSPTASKNMDRLVRELVSSEKRKTGISAASSFLAGRARRGDVIFMVSDFFSDENLESKLLPFLLYREFIPVVVRDSCKKELVKNARISYQDLETGKIHKLPAQTDIHAYDETLKKMFQKLFPGYLWLEGESFAEAIQIIAQWLYRRSIYK